MPEQDVQSAVDVSTDLVLASLAALTEAQLREPSALPGWTRAHVVTHLARSAEALVRVMDWAATGVEQQPYPSAEARDEDIQAGGRRSGAELAADLAAAAAAFEARVRTLPDEAWTTEVTPRGEPVTPARLLMVRLRELEIHHVDLAAGYHVEDIPEWVATWTLDDVLATFVRRSEPLAVRIRATDLDFERELGSGGPLVEGPLAGLLGWLSGRGGAAELTLAGADGAPVPADEGAELPAVPRWL
jgi:maleylpyruvate isomerase